MECPSEGCHAAGGCAFTVRKAATGACSGKIRKEENERIVMEKSRFAKLLLDCRTSGRVDGARNSGRWKKKTAGCNSYVYEGLDDAGRKRGADRDTSGGRKAGGQISGGL